MKILKLWWYKWKLIKLDTKIRLVKAYLEYSYDLVNMECNDFAGYGNRRIYVGAIAEHLDRNVIILRKLEMERFIVNMKLTMFQPET